MQANQRKALSYWKGHPIQIGSLSESQLEQIKQTNLKHITMGGSRAYLNFCVSREVYHMVRY